MENFMIYFFSAWCYLVFKDVVRFLFVLRPEAPLSISCSLIIITTRFSLLVVDLLFPKNKNSDERIVSCNPVNTQPQLDD